MKTALSHILANGARWRAIDRRRQLAGRSVNGAVLLFFWLRSHVGMNSEQARHQLIETMAND